MEQKSISGKLAIVSVDLSGYSRLMEEDERGTHQTLMACRRDILEPAAARSHGQIIKSTGDGALIAFPTAKDAMEGMIAFQDRVALCQIKSPSKWRLIFRIGIHLTEAIRDDGDLYGHGVNLAVRLQEAAEPGSIYLSQMVAEQLEETTGVEIVCLGKRVFKNLKKPVSVYCWQNREAKKRAQHRSRRQSCEATAVAALIGFGLLVLPLEVMRSAEDIVQLRSTILPDKDIRKQLAQDPSVSLGKDDIQVTEEEADEPTAERSHDQKFHYALVGQISSDDGLARVNVRKNAHLHGRPLWAEALGGLKEASSGAASMEIDDRSRPSTLIDVQLDASQRALLSRHDIADDLYAQAWMFFRGNTPEDFRRAWLALTEALVLAPGHDETQALLAAVYWTSWQNKWQFGTGYTAARTLRLAQHHLNRVSEPTAMAHVVTSEMLTASGHHDQAIEEAERAMILQPSLGVGYYAKGLALLFDGRPDQAEGLIRTARQLDPHASSYLFGLALAEFHQERFKEAFTTLSRATTANAQDDWPFLLLAATSGFLRAYDDAKHALGRFDRLSVERRGWFAAQIPYVRSWPFKNGLDRERLRRGLILAGIPDIVRVAAR